MENQKIYYTLAFYRFVKINDPVSMVIAHKKFFTSKDITCRIYISEEGINGQMSGESTALEAYKNWMQTFACFKDLCFKAQKTSGNVFPRISVKYRKQLVALDETVPIEKTGTYVSPSEWKHRLQEGKSLVIDVRNSYESKIGHFENALLPDLENFREFPLFAKKLLEKIDPKTPILMYCTGGIRCELYSALLRREGFSDVGQLDGGVIGYALEEGSALWKGKLFVFDDRISIPLDEKVSSPISSCSFCDTPSDVYFNCCNSECNKLFLSCSECIQTKEGSCSVACAAHPEKRAFTSEGNKPFRRKHLLNQ
ncbi:UPF0176 protein [Candidatus Clavichlamydia salmonicola]|uniref:oxygen-dependent tRNA uridine(34) hydroxylase TrhO n=1 Tax=Candidatus Clavichlamydia salmonicola TaxID=469812 RepID=UPI001891A4D7|nr:rhodanese-related sulfurtransferase [Candidatus Clavichlamydia salmonicola]MBF5050651.1 UPF0176 protein [Candidatus Clavichlamydia salmonicola]